MGIMEIAKAADAVPIPADIREWKILAWKAA